MRNLEVIFLSASFFLPLYTNAQKDSLLTFYTPEFEELLNLERLDKGEPSVSIAGFKATTLRETPGIVTLITADEIRNSGAKDLLDVLRMVPGFDFALDIQPVLTVRGNGVNEAKILFQVDGQQINDISFGYTLVMQRFPLNNIERIEIIRGAGSAIYGGMAGLAVVNIITKNPTSNQEIGLANIVGATTLKTLMRNNNEVYSLSKFNNGLQVSISAARLAGKMTDINYFGGLYNDDPRRNFVDNERLSDIQTSYVNVGLKFKKLDVRFIQNAYYNALPQLGNAQMNIRGIYFNLSYRFDLSDNLSLYTRLNIKEQNPYTFSDVPPAFYDANDEPQGRLLILDVAGTLDRRYLVNSYFLYQPRKNVTITLGTEGFLDNVRYINNLRFRDGSDRVSFGNLGAFAEANIQSSIANITVGGRIDKYTNINAVFVPRVAITKALEKFHFKALYSEAFKTPTVQNIQFRREGSEVKPETYRLIELETGLKIKDKLLLTVNAYDIFINDFIVRRDTLIFNNPSVIYENGGQSGTRGIEVDAKWSQKWGYFRAGYSFYRVSIPNDIQRLPLVPTDFSGTPAHKFTLQGNLKISKDFSLNPTFMYITNKFKILDPILDRTDSEEFPNEQHIHLFANYDNFLLKNLSFGLGCYNLLNQRQWLIPWKTDFSSRVVLPSQGRELYVRIVYHLKY
ncbi:MAG: TonB-dependent receptor plug domain-containing protein [Raineya sp.]|nr:TonB-dependent receptor plug domain-containing protein [Raineya sp.]MDW8296463.1 TonB-dependent receptor plug domain-containing protein [Raineya sp.]